MEIIKSIGVKIGTLMAFVTFGGLYLVAVTILSLLLGIPMRWISFGILAWALLWEAGEWLIPWVRLKWYRHQRKGGRSE